MTLTMRRPWSKNPLPFAQNIQMLQTPTAVRHTAKILSGKLLQSRTRELQMFAANSCVQQAIRPGSLTCLLVPKS